MHNRRFLRTVVLLLCLAMLLPLTLAAAGCTGGSGTASGTDAPAGSATEPSTQPDTDAQPGSETVTTGGGTETETDAPAPVPTRFNEGKVDYKTEKKTTVYEAFDENGRNTVMEKGATGVVTLFDEDFSDGDPNCGGKATSRSARRDRRARGEAVHPLQRYGRRRRRVDDLVPRNQHQFHGLQPDTALRQHRGRGRRQSCRNPASSAATCPTTHTALRTTPVTASGSPS